MFILIAGGGKVGFNLAYTLSQEANKEVTVIDKNKTALDKFKEMPTVKTVHGDGTDPRILEYVGITTGTCSGCRNRKRCRQPRPVHDRQEAIRHQAGDRPGQQHQEPVALHAGARG